jgi:hypothetical protein
VACLIVFHDSWDVSGAIGSVWNGETMITLQGLSLHACLEWLGCEYQAARD